MAMGCPSGGLSQELGEGLGKDPASPAGTSTPPLVARLAGLPPQAPELLELKSTSGSR